MYAFSLLQFVVVERTKNIYREIPIDATYYNGCASAVKFEMNVDNSGMIIFVG